MEGNNSQNKVDDVKRCFDAIKKLMKQGYTKSSACKKLNLPRNWIYKNFTAKQMVILDHIYYSFSTGERARYVIGGGKNKAAK